MFWKYSPPGLPTPSQIGILLRTIYGCGLKLNNIPCGLKVGLYGNNSNYKKYFSNFLRLIEEYIISLDPSCLHTTFVFISVQKLNSDQSRPKEGIVKVLPENFFLENASLSYGARSCPVRCVKRHSQFLSR